MHSTSTKTSDDTPSTRHRRTAAGDASAAAAHGSEVAMSSISPAALARRAVRPWHRYAIRRLLTVVGKPRLAVALWDGQEIRASDAPPAATIVIHSARALRRMALNPFYQFCEAYSNGQVDVIGDLVETIMTIDRAFRASRSAQFLYNMMTRWLRMPRFNTLSASRDNVHHHYDIGNDFYRLWLDEQLAYTCAYFPDPEASLEAAQVAKFDYVCRKIALQPGETVVEAGCGWGGLALHMARHYGVTVKAYNVSHEQVAYARARAEAEGLADRVEFIEDDWRRISGRYDAFVSIGMLEHVGPANYRRLGDVIHRVLTVRGRGIIHSIGRNKPAPVDLWIERRIFPGSYPPSLAEMLQVLEPREFSILDVENLRLHYARTLSHWLERFERAIDQITRMFDERFARMWRLYLAGSIVAFQSGGLQLFQVVFARGDLNDMPLTRAHLYADAPVLGRAAHASP
jgi:cyclopropane-fatty-acyl-phospholipid synthase